ncbi:hypothetical protein D3C75_1375530 [compost metagenome]
MLLFPDGFGPEAPMELFGLYSNDEGLRVQLQNGLVQPALIFSLGQNLHDQSIPIPATA